jgi:thiamine biosynthesis lipoprotein
MKNIKVLIFTLLLLLISACQPKPEKLEMFNSVSLSAGFDTYISVSVATSSQEEFDKIFNEVVEDFQYLNKLFDIYNNYEGVNNIKTINDNAGIKPVKVDPIIIDMLELSKEYYDISNHEFDITLGPVLKIWHNYRDEGLTLMQEGKFGNIPSLEELQEAYTCVGWDLVEINKEDSTVYLNKECASLDVGGIAKGFATEYIAKKLEDKNIKVGFIDAGGNNRTINTKLDNSPWRVGIQHPLGGDGALLVVNKEGSSSFVTSGDYQRYYIAEDGNQYHHIIDPSTLFPANHFHSVTVITKDSGIADALSTTLFTVDYETGMEIVEEFKKNHPNETLDVIWTMNKNIEINSDYVKEIDGFKVVYTKDLEDKLTWK